jgi:hypothetical protein
VAVAGGLSVLAPQAEADPTTKRANAAFVNRMPRAYRSQTAKRERASSEEPAREESSVPQRPSATRMNP